MEHLVDVAAPPGETEVPPQQQEQTAEQAAQQAYEQQVSSSAWPIAGTRRCHGDTPHEVLSCNWPRMLLPILSAVVMNALEEVCKRQWFARVSSSRTHRYDAACGAAQLAEHANMQQMHMTHQQYELEQQQAAQQEHYDAHVGHKRESEDPDCECPTRPTRNSFA
jgi:hypothetical protein